MRVGEPQDGDHERDVGLDRADDLAHRRAVLGDQRQQAVARLRQRREHLERLEGGREALPVTLVVRAADDAGRRHRPRTRPRSRRAARRGRGESSSVGRPSDQEDREQASRPAFSGYRQRVDIRLRTASIRRAIRRVPSSLSVSKMPGETVPSGERDADRLVDLPRLRPGVLQHALQRRFQRFVGSTAPSTAASASRAFSSRSSASGEPRIFSRAAGSSAGPSKKNPASGQKSASVEIFSCEISAASRSPSRPSAPRAARQVVEPQLAQVAAVDVAQLLLVEHGRRLRDPLERELALELARW